MNSLPAMRFAHRQVLNLLLAGEWKFASRLRVPVTSAQLNVMLNNGWLERRGEGHAIEIKITSAGVAALKAPI